jgi:cytochrome c-type biogenesis protein CcmH/NrfG
MAFILPVVGFNEAMLPRMKRRVWSIAKRLGATVIKKEKVEVAKRTRRPLAVEDIETVFLNEEKKEQEIILSAKRLKAQEKENEKKKKARAKKRKKNKK